jgi:swainsonine biosynthesis oxidoreductase SwnR
LRLIECKENHTYVVGEVGTWNSAVKLLEEFHNRTFSKRTKSAEEIQTELEEASFDNPGQRMATEMDAWNISGASVVPWAVVEKQRKTYFEGVKFRTIRELLEEGERQDIV